MQRVTTSTTERPTPGKGLQAMNFDSWSRFHGSYKVSCFPISGLKFEFDVNSVNLIFSSSGRPPRLSPHRESDVNPRRRRVLFGNRGVQTRMPVERGHPSLHMCHGRNTTASLHPISALFHFTDSVADRSGQFLSKHS